MFLASQRHLVVFQRVGFIRACLEATVKGTQRLGRDMSGNPFRAGLQWLDLAKGEAVRFLDDRSNPLHLPKSVTLSFSKALKLSNKARIEDCADSLRSKPKTYANDSLSAKVANQA